MHRDPVAQYLSIQRGRLAELREGGGEVAPGGKLGTEEKAWHCFESDPAKCPKRPAVDSTYHVNTRDVGFFVAESIRLQALASAFNPLISRSFEDCTANATECAAA